MNWPTLPVFVFRPIVSKALLKTRKKVRGVGGCDKIILSNGQATFNTPSSGTIVTGFAKISLITYYFKMR